MIKLSLIASGANNSIIENVNVLNCEIKISASSSVTHSSSLYVAGLVAEMVNTTITNSTINISADIGMTILAGYTDSVAAAGIASTATASVVKNTVVTFSLSTISANTFNYVGGVVAYSENNSIMSRIDNVDVAFSVNNVKSLYMGGLVGYAKNIVVENCDISGNCGSSSNLVNATYIGGIVGYLQNSTITNSGSLIEFNFLVGNNPDNKFIGELVGYMSNSEITNCYSLKYDSNQELTIINVAPEEIVIGIYGGKYNSSVNACERKSKK